MGVRQIVATGRRLLRTTLRDSALIGDRTLVGDGRGGWIESWTDRAQPVDCRFVRRQSGFLTDTDPRGGSGEFDSPEGAALLVEHDASIPEGSRVVNVATGERWIATADQSVSSELKVLTRVSLREMDEGT